MTVAENDLVLEFEITEAKLSALVGARQLLKRKREELHALEKGLEKLEAEVLENLKAGVPAAEGWSVSIIRKHGRCCPKWKGIFTDHMLLEHGQAAKVTEYEAQKAAGVGPSSEELEVLPPMKGLQVVE